jgi:proteic killer suppression protein
MVMKDIFDVRLARSALKDLKKVPVHIASKLQAWIDDVGHHGLSEIRKIPGYHDEPLKGKRMGQRSIRLSRAYRAIYIVGKDGSIEFIEMMEVNKHEY